MGTTKYYQLQKIDEDGALHDDPDLFASVDRDTIDEKIRASQIHTHEATTTQPAAPTLQLFTTGGTIPANTTVRYRVTYTDSDTGETIASDTASVVTGVGSTNRVSVTRGTIPAGNTWSIYRTYDTDDFSESFLTQQANGTSAYSDTGTDTQEGGPPSLWEPQKITLTDAEEARNILPQGFVDGFPHTFSFWRQDVSAATGVFHLPIEFEVFTILGVRATCATAPSGGSVVVDVLRYRSAAWASIFTSTFPTVTAGNIKSTRVTPTTTDLVVDDLLRVDITTGNATAEGVAVVVYGVTQPTGGAS